MTARATPVKAVVQVGVLALLAVAEFMLTLDISIVNVALPSIRDDLGFSRSELEWVVNGYALTFGGVLLLGGRAADLFGGRRVSPLSRSSRRGSPLRRWCRSPPFARAGWRPATR
jgi:MFS family permease